MIMMMLVVRTGFFRLLLLPLIFTQVLCADDASTRASIQTSLTSAFRNLSQMGKLSMIAIDTHDSLNSQPVPFAALAADYDPAQTTETARYTNRLKTFNVSDTNVASSLPAMSVESIDFRIDSLDTTPIYQYAVAVRQEALKTPDGATVLIGADGIVPPASGTVNPVALIKSTFNTKWNQDNDNGLNRQLELVKHLTNYPSNLRVFAYSSNVLMPSNGQTMDSAFTSANWTALDASLGAAGRWTDFAPTTETTGFLKGSPIIYKGGLLVNVGGSRVKTVSPFRVDKTGRAASYPGSSIEANELRVVDRNTRTGIDAVSLQKRWIAGQIVGDDSTAVALGIGAGVRLKAMASYDDGIICLTDKGIYKVTLKNVADDAKSKNITTNALAIPDFSRYIDMSVAGSDAGVIYLALLRKDTLFDFAKITTDTTGRASVQIVTIPVYVVSVSVDRRGHVAMVDSQIHEAWWANANDIFSPTTNFDFNYLQSLVRSQGSAYVRVQSEIAILKNSINSLQSQQDSVNSQIAAIEAITMSPTYVANAANTATLNALYPALNSLMSQMSMTMADLKNALDDLDSFGVQEGAEMAVIAATRDALQAQQNRVIAAQQATVSKCNASINTILTNFGAAVGLNPADVNALKADTGADPRAFTANLTTLMATIQTYTATQTAALNQLQTAAAAWQSSVTAGSTASGAVSPISTANARAQQDYITAQQGQIDMFTKVAVLYQAELDKVTALLTSPDTLSHPDTVVMLTTSQTDLTAKLQAILNQKKSLIEAVTAQLASLSQITTDMTNRLASVSSSYTALQATYAASQATIAGLNQQITAQTTAYNATLAEKEASITRLTTTNNALQAQIDQLNANASAASANITASLRSALSNSLDATQGHQEVLHADLTRFSDGLKGALGAAGVDSAMSQQIADRINSTVTALNTTIASQQALIASLTADRNNAVAAITSAVSGTAMLPDGISSVGSMATQYSESMNAKYDSIAAALTTQRNQIQTELTALTSQIQLQSAAAASQSAATSAAGAAPDAAQPAQGSVGGQPTLASLQARKTTLEQQLSAVTAKISSVNAAKTAETEKQNTFVTAYQAAATALTNALSSPVADPNDLAALVTKLNLVSTAKDGMIKILSAQVKKLQDDLAEKNAQMAASGIQSQQDLAARDAQLATLNAALAAQNAQMQQDLTNKRAQIAALQTQETTLRTSKFTPMIAAQVKKFTDLSDAEKALLAANNITDVSNALTNLVNTKNLLIAQVQQLLRSTNASDADQAAMTAALTASQAQQTQDAQALQSIQDALSAAMNSAAGESIDGHTGFSFADGSSLLQRFNAIMDLRKAQMQRIRDQAAQDSRAAQDAISDIAARLATAQAAAAGLTTLSDAQRSTIADLQRQQTDLQSQLAAKDQQIRDAQSNLTLIQQQMQRQIDDLRAEKTTLTNTIAAKQAIIESQTATIAEKDRAIAEKTSLSSQLAASLRAEQDRTATLADDLNRERANYAAQTLILTKSQHDLSLSQGQVRDLQAQLQAVLDAKARTDAAYEAQIAALTALNNANRAQIQNLQQNQTVLLGQVNVLSNIIDKHVNFRDLDQKDKDDLQHIMSGMNSAEANLLMMIINGTFSIDDLVPYRVLWFDQDFNFMINQYANALTAAAKAATDAAAAIPAVSGATTANPLVTALQAVAAVLTNISTTIQQASVSLDAINTATNATTLSSAVSAAIVASNAAATAIAAAAPAASAATTAAGSGTDAPATALKDAAGVLQSFLAADVYTKINELIIVHRLLYALEDSIDPTTRAVTRNLKEEYAALSFPSASATSPNVVVKYFPDMVNLDSSAILAAANRIMNTAPTSGAAPTFEHSFRGAVSQAVLPLLQNEALRASIAFWGRAAKDTWNKAPANDTTFNDRIAEMMKILTGKNVDGSDYSFATAITQVKLNAIFVQQQHATELQTAANTAAVAAATAAADDAKSKLAQAIASGASSLAAAQTTYRNALEAKDQAINEAKALVQSLSRSISASAAAATNISLNIMKRQTTNETQSKNLAFFQSRMSELNAQAQALQTALAAGTGNPALLDAILAEQERLTRNNQYGPYVLPLALTLAQDGSIVKYARRFNIATPVGAPALYTETGLEERNGSAFENIVLSCLDLSAGSAGYLDVASIDAAGFVTMGATNRFTASKVKVVSRGDNLVSFETDKAGTHLCLTLEPMAQADKVAMIRAMAPDAIAAMLVQLASAAQGAVDAIDPATDSDGRLRAAAQAAVATAQTASQNGAAALTAGQAILATAARNSAASFFANNPAAVAAANAVLTDVTVNYAANSLAYFNVNFLPLPNAATVTDAQCFYVEGIDQPAFPEAVILRTHDSSNGFANDMAGYLSIKPDATGKNRIVYSPWISTEYHARPGYGETNWGIHRMDAVSHSEEFTLQNGLAAMVALDNRTVVDSDTGFTAYDKALADLLKSLGDELPSIQRNSHQFQDFVLKFTEYVSFRQANRQMTPKDLVQFKNFGRTIASNIFGAGASSNLPVNSAGYKALLGSVDATGKPVAGTGLVNAADIVSSVSFGDRDYVSLASGGVAVSLDDSKAISLRANSSLSKYANFVLNKDQASGSYRLLVHPAFGDGKLVVAADNSISIQPVATVVAAGAGSDLFNIALASGQSSKVTISSATGYFKVVADADGKNSRLTFAPLAAGQAPDFNFDITVSSADSFRAKLVSLAGQVSGTDSSGRAASLADLVATELNRDKTQANKTVADTKEYINASVTDANRAAFAPVVQSISLAIRGAPSLAGVVDLTLVDALETSLAVFALKQPQYFILKDGSNAVLKLGGAYVDNATTTLDGAQTHMLCYDYELADPATIGFDRSTVFKVVPHPTKPGVYVLIGYLEQSGAPVYAQAKDITAKDKDTGTNELSLSFITGSASSFDKDGSISQIPAEWFEITGTMGSIKIRANSVVDPAKAIGFLGSIADPSYQSAINAQITAKNAAITTLGTTVTTLTQQKTQADTDLQVASDTVMAATMASLILTPTGATYDFTTHNPLVAQLQTASPAAYTLLTAAVDRLKTLDDANKMKTDANTAGAAAQERQTKAISDLAKAQSDLATRRTELSALSAALTAKPVKVLKTAADVAAGAINFALEQLSPVKAKILLSDVDKLTKNLYDTLNDINNGDSKLRVAAADDALSAFDKVVFGGAAPIAGQKPVVKQYLLTNNFDKIVTDMNNADLTKRSLSVQDLLGFIKTDFKYNSRTGTGINFSDTAVAIINKLSDIFIIKEPLAINDENMARIQLFEGMDLAVALKQYNTDKVKLRRALTPMIGYIKNVKDADVVWLDGRKTALDATTLASNTTDIALKDLDTLIVRQDLTDTYKASLIYKIRNIIAAGTGLIKDSTGKTTDSVLNDFLMALLDKMQPPVVSTTGQKPTKYSELALYDRLDLAENMLNGRYRELDGSFVMKKDSAKALEVLATITDAEIAAEKDATGFTAWKIQLKALADADQKATTSQATPTAQDTFKATIKSLGILRPLKVVRRGAKATTTTKPAVTGLGAPLGSARNTGTLAGPLPSAGTQATSSTSSSSTTTTAAPVAPASQSTAPAATAGTPGSGAVTDSSSGATPPASSNKSVE